MLRLARIIAVHPQRRRVDVVFLDNGQRVADVPVAAGAVASDSGSWAVPSAPRPANDSQAADLPTSGRAMIAVCGFAADRPMVIGFHQPGTGAMAPSEQDRAIYRHPSGTYATVAPDGTVEVKHASGAHLRIGAGGTAPVPGVPAGGGGAAPTVTLKTENVELKIAPDGKVTLEASNNVEMTTPTLKVNGNVEIAGNLSVAAAGGGGATVTMTGNIVLDGNMSASGNLAADGEVQAGSIPLTSHRHQNVQPGGGNSGTPIA